MIIGDILILKIEDLAFGGRGVARDADGQVVFVPFTAVGDEIEAQVTAIHKNYADARITRLLEPGAGRTKPRCPYYGRCGGCCYQHLEYGQEFAAKVKQLHDLLERVGKLKNPVNLDPLVRSPHLYGYRNKITLHPIMDGATIHNYGFYQIDNETLFPVSVCPLAQPIINDMLYEIQTPAHPGIDNRHGESLTLRSSSHDDVYLFCGRGTTRMPWLSECLFPAKRTQAELETAADINQDGALPLYGCSADDNAEVQVPLNSFWQVNSAVAAQLFQLVRGWVGEMPGKCLIDAYAGAGPFSLVLGELFECIILIETDAQALAAARQNHHQRGLKSVQILHRQTEQALPHILKKQAAEMSGTTVILDPPRGGCSKAVLNALAANRPNRIIYISCNASTFARDMQRLQERGGYVLKHLALLDMFPRTAHFETAACLLPADR